MGNFRPRTDDIYNFAYIKDVERVSHKPIVNDFHIGSTGDPIRSINIDAGAQGLDVYMDLFGAKREHLKGTFEEILEYTNKEWYEQEPIDGEVSTQTKRGITSYYYTTDQETGVHEISIKGEDITEDDIWQAAEAMIEEIKKE